MKCVSVQNFINVTPCKLCIAPDFKSVFLLLLRFGMRIQAPWSSGYFQTSDQHCGGTDVRVLVPVIMAEIFTSDSSGKGLASTFIFSVLRKDVSHPSDIWRAYVWVNCLQRYSAFNGDVKRRQGNVKLNIYLENLSHHRCLDSMTNIEEERHKYFVKSKNTITTVEVNIRVFAHEFFAAKRIFILVEHFSRNTGESTIITAAEYKQLY